MNSQTARLFVLATSLLALVSICVALLLGLRLRETRADYEDFLQDDACPGQTATRGSQ
jgi:hypothetical protein